MFVENANSAAGIDLSQILNKYLCFAPKKKKKLIEIPDICNILYNCNL